MFNAGFCFSGFCYFSLPSLATETASKIHLNYSNFVRILNSQLLLSKTFKNRPKNALKMPRKITFWDPFEKPPCSLSQTQLGAAEIHILASVRSSATPANNS